MPDAPTNSKNIWSFDPRMIPGCQLWLDAADTSTFNSGSISSGNTITSWNDKSGTAASITVGGTPVWNSNTLCNLPSVDLTSGRFSGTFATALSNYASTCFIVTSLNSYPTGGYPCLAFQNTPSGSFIRILDFVCVLNNKHPYVSPHIGQRSSTRRTLPDTEQCAVCTAV